MKAKVCFIVAGDIKSPQKCSFQLKWYQDVSLSVRMYHHDPNWRDFFGI